MIILKRSTVFGKRKEWHSVMIARQPRSAEPYDKCFDEVGFEF